MNKEIDVVKGWELFVEHHVLPERLFYLANNPSNSTTRERNHLASCKCCSKAYDGYRANPNPDYVDS
jgi:hypothetical protein